MPLLAIASYRIAMTRLTREMRQIDLSDVASAAFAFHIEMTAPSREFSLDERVCGARKAVQSIDDPLHSIASIQPMIEINSIEITS